MTLSLYDISVPVFSRTLQNLAAGLEEARTFADENGIEHDELLDARLNPDMEPLTARVLQACDTALAAVARLRAAAQEQAGGPEAGFDQLEAAIMRTISHLDALPENCMGGQAEARIELPHPDSETTIASGDYLLHRALPEFFFHAAMAFAVLRHNGVPLVTRDFVVGRFTY